MSSVQVDVEPQLLRDRDLPPRCDKGVISSAVSNAIQRLIDDDLEGNVRPWDVAGLRRGRQRLVDVDAVQVTSVDAEALVAEETKNEIFDGATPYTIWRGGVIIDGDRGVLLYGSGDEATLIEG